MQMEAKTLQRTPFIPTNISLALFPAKTNACALLNQFKPQEKIEPERSPTVTNNRSRAMRQLERACAYIDNHAPNAGTTDSFKNHFEKIIRWRKLLGLLKYSSTDLSLFTLQCLPTLEKAMHRVDAGPILSAFMQLSKEASFEICLLNLGENTIRMGYKNAKNIVIHGNLSSWSFTEMTCGTVVVNGNCGSDFAARLKGGEITVNGDTEYVLGHEMSGGTINVNGNIGNICSSYSGGNIFQHGRQLVRNGKVIAQPENK